MLLSTTGLSQEDQRDSRVRLHKQRGHTQNIPLGAALKPTQLRDKIPEGQANSKLCDKIPEGQVTLNLRDKTPEGQANSKLCDKIPEGQVTLNLRDKIPGGVQTNQRVHSLGVHTQSSTPPS